MPLTREGNATVRSLAGLGHNVVIRLPIRKNAAGDVHGQLQELIDGGAPMLLFLDRIRRLHVDVRGEEPVTLERRVEAVPAAGSAATRAGQLGAQGTFLLSTVEVPAKRFRRALRESVDQGRIDARWLEWSDPAAVSVAVRTDEVGRTTGSYCFLPMGEDARSPFQGHVNAPFSVAIARKALVEKTPLNELCSTWPQSSRARPLQRSPRPARSIGGRGPHRLEARRRGSSACRRGTGADQPRAEAAVPDLAGESLGAFGHGLSVDRRRADSHDPCDAGTGEGRGA